MSEVSFRSTAQCSCKQYGQPCDNECNCCDSLYAIEGCDCSCKRMKIAKILAETFLDAPSEPHEIARDEESPRAPKVRYVIGGDLADIQHMVIRCTGRPQHVAKVVVTPDGGFIMRLPCTEEVHR